MELLAPAGTYECVVAAVNSGADAVYLAGKSFGARSFAGNLSDEEIFKACDFCHLRGVKVYITVNTLIFDREFAELEAFIRTITKAGADAVIVQDLGVLSLVKEISPDMEIHASTQLTVHSSDGVSELYRLGAERVVLARELSFDEIADIISDTKAEAEVFVHGAMCMSYSGQCLMSSVIGGRSGNRGKCAQPCRLSYVGKDGKEAFYMSLKDMSYAEHIDKLRKIGVSSLKIEGRMKGADYVSTVVSVYRKLIDKTAKPTKEDIDRLNSVFFRGGLTDGYFTGKKGVNMFAFDKPDNPYAKNSNKPAPVLNRQINAEISARFKVGELPEAEMTAFGATVKVKGENIVSEAKTKPADKQLIEDKMSKTGGTAFLTTVNKIELSQNAFVSVAEINALRRQAVEKLESVIVEKYKNKRLNKSNSDFRAEKEYKGSRYTCFVSNLSQYASVFEFDFEYIFIPIDVVKNNCDFLKQDLKRIVLSLPVILRNEDREHYSRMLKSLKNAGFNKAEISTLDAKELCEGFEIFSNHRLNLTNVRACKAANIDNICLSAELSLARIRDISRYVNCEIAVYGRIPIMITENCIIKNINGCPCRGYGKITDRTGREFPIVKDGNMCRSVVLNSYPLYMADKADDLKAVKADRLRLIFTTETPDECVRIVNEYINGSKKFLKEFTRLHMYKAID